MLYQPSKQVAWSPPDQGDSMEQKRELFRVALERPGELRRGTEIAECHLKDLTEKGVRLTTELSAACKEMLDLHVKLTDNADIQCTIQVTFALPPFIGARIVDISPDHRRQLSRFLEQVNGLNLTGF